MGVFPVTNLTRRTFIATAALAGGSLLLAACGGGGTDHGAGHGSAGTTTGAAGTPGMPGHGAMGSGEYDRDFIDGMVPHHQAAIDMAKVAQRKAEHPELKQLADAIVADQDGEIAQMKAWRKAWYGSDEIAPGLGGHQMGGMDTDLAQLEAAVPFDKAFIDAMIPHHQSAIDMAKEAQTKATHQEIKDLAGRIVSAQQREIDQMKTWRSQWYPG
jgi:uncharacterized protein (DUF305 family)